MSRNTHTYGITKTQCIGLKVQKLTCLSCVDTSPVGTSSVGPSPSSLLTRQLQESWRSLRRLGEGSPPPSGRRLTDSLMFEVTDASVVQDGSSKYVVNMWLEIPDVKWRTEQKFQVQWGCFQTQIQKWSSNKIQLATRHFYSWTWMHLESEIQPVGLCLSSCTPSTWSSPAAVIRLQP